MFRKRKQKRGGKGRRRRRRRNKAGRTPGRKKLAEGNKAMREAIEDGSRTESFTGGRETEKKEEKKTRARQREVRRWERGTASAPAGRRGAQQSSVLPAAAAV